MEGNYCEARAKKKVTGKDNAIKGAFIAGLVLFFLGALILTQPLLILGDVALGIFAYFYIPRLKVEYEYVFCDGQIDFDKIMNGEKRKNLAKIDCDQVVAVAPVGSHTLDGYRHDKVRVYDYSSLEEDAKVWAIVTSVGEQPAMYLFEPDEEMLQKIKYKTMRKFSEY